jgi:hypothetical protein
MVILSKTAQTGIFDGDWFQIPPQAESQTAVIVSVKAGTATVALEGRNSQDDTPVVIDSRSASGGYLANRYRQIRARLTAATAATVVVSVAANAQKTV